MCQSELAELTGLPERNLAAGQRFEHDARRFRSSSLKGHLFIIGRTRHIMLK